MTGRRWCILTAVVWLILCLAGCSSTKHVPQGKYLLDKVAIRVDSTPEGAEIDTEKMQAYLAQTANHKMLWSMKMRLGVYNLSGSDSTRFWNRWMRKLGEAPVIYDEELTATSVDQLRKSLVNRGYLHAEVQTDTVADRKKKKMKVTYHLNPGKAWRIASLEQQIADSAVAAIVSSLDLPVKVGDVLDRTMLDTQRSFIASRLREKGYFGFTKESITFSADTTAGSTEVDLTMRISMPAGQNQNLLTEGGPFDVWAIRRIVVITDFDPARDADPLTAARSDTVSYKGIDILYGEKRYLRPSVIYENIFMRPGALFRDSELERTYSALSRLTILKFINIRMVPAGMAAGLGMVDAYILLTPGKSMTASLELEGTNSEGDLGIAAGITFSHRNIGRGSETLTTKIQGAYEALSGKLDDLLHNRYMEYSADVSLSFPKFKAPFLSERFRRRINATSTLNVSMNYQERPEYTRLISTAGWAYKWTHRNMRWRQTFTPIDINYVYLPRTTYNFLDQIAPDNPLLRYSYEDHFIMRMGYNFYHTDRRTAAPWEHGVPQSFYTLRANAEIAGNFLFALSSIFERRRNFHEHPYSVFGIRYSQYVKVEGDFSYLWAIDHRNSVAFHAGAGIGIPYGNSTILPFEKRFYGGGANGVRGWAVRTLGPGSYPGVNSVSDFINQCGDIRLELNAEYRTKLFWVLELGAFIDIGNIWTIRNYENQPGGVFKFQTFYKQLAAAYGLGLRMDFDYFLLRFDLGMKAHNPARGEKPWPLLSPSWHRDASFHFSIGYPF